MPIRSSERDRYPADWPAISLARREAAGWRCECRGECGSEHTSGGTADHGPDGNTDPARCGWHHGDDRMNAKATGNYTVVLTVAHLDHTPENVADDNLRAMCQPCHLRYDAAHHAATRRANAAGGPPLPMEYTT